MSGEILDPQEIRFGHLTIAKQVGHIIVTTMRIFKAYLNARKNVATLTVSSILGYAMRDAHASMSFLTKTAENVP